MTFALDGLQIERRRTPRAVWNRWRHLNLRLSTWPRWFFLLASRRSSGAPARRRWSHHGSDDGDWLQCRWRSVHSEVDEYVYVIVAGRCVGYTISKTRAQI